MSNNATPSTEPLLDYVTSCALPTPWAQFTLHAFVEHTTGKEHLVMALGDIGNGEPVLARVHSECLTGDVLFVMTGGTPGLYAYQPAFAVRG